MEVLAGFEITVVFAAGFSFSVIGFVFVGEAAAADELEFETVASELDRGEDIGISEAATFAVVSVEFISTGVAVSTTAFVMALLLSTVGKAGWLK